MPGLIARVIGGFFSGAILGAIPAAFIGCVVASGTELGYGPIVFFAAVLMGAFIGGWVGAVIVVVRSIEKTPDESKESGKDQVDNLST